MVSLAVGLSLGAAKAAVRTGPVAEWDFSESAGPYVDTRHGLALSVASGATAPLRKTDGFGPGVASLAFDGTDQHLVIPATATGPLQIGGVADGDTVAAWVNRTGDTNAAIAGIWPEDAADPQRQYALFLNLALYGGDDRVCGHVSKTGAPTPGYPYTRDYSWNARRLEPDGSDGWRFAVFTYDGSHIRSYLDGCFERVPSYTDIEGASGPANPYPFSAGLNQTPAEFTVGGVRLTGGYGNFLHGEIAKLRVWDRALSAAEISQLFQADRLAGRPLFLDSFRTVEKVSSRALGWRSFLGAGCVETTDLAPGDSVPEMYNFAGAGAGQGGYLARTTAATGIGAGYFDGCRAAPLHWDDVASIKWSMNNAAPVDTVRVLVRANGVWYASAGEFSCTASHTAQDWSNAEHFSLSVSRAAAFWRAVTLEPGDGLALGQVLESDMTADTLEAFGFLCDDTGSGTVRIDDLTLVAA